MNISMRGMFDTGWLSAIAVGVVAKIDWVALIGITLGVIAAYQRYQTVREAKRANDIRERELAEDKSRTGTKRKQNG
ncbi:MAG: hypothetical protein ACRC8W_04690 [Plesiomonas shigelloides]